MIGKSHGFKKIYEKLLFHGLLNEINGNTFSKNLKMGHAFGEFALPKFGISFS